MNRLLLISAIIVLLLGHITLQAQKVNLDSLNRVVNENHLAGLELIKKGNKAEGLKKLNNAVSAFREIDYELGEKRDSVKLVIEGWLKDIAESPFLNYLMGNIIYLTKRDSAGLANAKEYFYKSIELEPNFIPPYRGLATVAEFQKDDVGAINLYNKAIEIDSTYYSTYLRLAYLYSKSGDISAAESLYNKVIQNDASSYNKVWATLNMADIKKTFVDKRKLYDSALLLAKTADDSITIYNKILWSTFAEDKNNFIAFADDLLTKRIGRVRELRMNILYKYYDYLKKYDADKILEFANRIIEEKHPLVLLMAGSYFTYEKKDFQNGLKFLLKAYEVTDSESVYETILHGQKNEARLKEIARKFKYGTVGSALGKTYLELKDYGQAEEYLRQAIPLEESKRNPEPFYLLSQALREQNKIKEAIENLAKGLALKEDKEQKKIFDELIEKQVLNKTADQLIREVRMSKATTAMDFTLKTLEGKDFMLAEQKGKVVVLDFWATWCGPCVAELPHLVKLQEKYFNNPNVVFQGIDTDETPQLIKEFMKKNGYSFNVLTAVGTTVSKDYGVTAIPTMFIIDKQGRIQFKHIGFDSKENIVEALSKEIDELLITN